MYVSSDLAEEWSILEEAFNDTVEKTELTAPRDELVSNYNISERDTVLSMKITAKKNVNEMTNIRKEMLAVVKEQNEEHVQQFSLTDTGNIKTPLLEQLTVLNICF